MTWWIINYTKTEGKRRYVATDYLLKFMVFLVLLFYYITMNLDHIM